MEGPYGKVASMLRRITKTKGSVSIVRQGQNEHVHLYVDICVHTHTTHIHSVVMGIIITCVKMSTDMSMSLFGRDG